MVNGLQSGLQFTCLVYSLQSGLQSGLRFTVCLTVHSVAYTSRLTPWFTVYGVYGLRSGLQFTVRFTELFTVYDLRSTVNGLQSGLQFTCLVYSLQFGLQSGLRFQSVTVPALLTLHG